MAVFVRPEERQRQSRFAAITLLFLLCVVAGILWRFQPPPAVPASAAQDAFSSGRAMAHVREISRTVHSTGTPEQARVREYLLGQFRALGLKPVVQEGGASNNYGDVTHVAHVKNILARLPGTAGGGPALMLAAHYDSVPTGPGAGDDGASVGVLLETLRALKAGPPLKNDVLVLLTDGEERGLFGAKVFVAEYPDLKTIRLVLNFEARGSGGPVFLFETTEGNEGLIGECGRVLTRSAASSLFYTLYKSLPNDTDLTVFKKNGIAGLNFAFVDGWNRYHTPADTPANLDERSVQHMGMYALTLTRRFGNADLDALTRKDQEDAVFFDVLGLTLIRYPQSFAGPLTVCALFAFLAILIAGFRAKWLTPGGFVLSLLILPLLIVAVGFGAGFLWEQFLSFFPDFRRIPWGDPYRRPLFETAFVLLTLFVFALAHALLGGISLRDRAAGALFWWTALLLVATQFAPGTSYAFLFPLLAGLAALLALPRREKTLLSGQEEKPMEWGGLLVLLASAAVILLLWTQLIHGLFLLVSFARPPVPNVALVLLLGLLTPQIGTILIPRRWPLPLFAFLAGAGLLVGGGLTNRFDAAHPATNTLLYAQGTGEGKAVWVSRADKRDEWTAKYLGKSPRRPTQEIFPGRSSRIAYDIADAPELNLPEPEIVVLENRTDGKNRTIRLRIRSPRQSPDMYILVRPEAGEPGRGLFSEARVGVPEEGYEVRFTTPDDGKTLKVLVDDYAHGLPEIPAEGIPTRPPHLMRTNEFPGTDVTLVRKTMTLPDPQKQNGNGPEDMPLPIPELVVPL
jgi:hypothetical protein